MRRRILAIVEVTAEMAWDLAVQYIAQRKAIIVLQQRVTDLEYAVALRGRKGSS